MRRPAFGLLLLAIALPVLSTAVENGAAAIQSYFTGKQVVLKIDMPGTQKGVDLRFNRNSPMDWKEYSSRVKQFGPAIRKGDSARVTGIVVKKDTIEFQLDGGGFGTFGDDTDTTVHPRVLDKSDYEKQLEKQISQTTDPDKKRQLQRDLDRERARRERQNAINQNNAQVASQIKAARVADKRLTGGSRFNLRWQGSIPGDQLTPGAVMKLLADYVDFGGLQAGSAPLFGSGGRNSFRGSAGWPTCCFSDRSAEARYDHGRRHRLARPGTATVRIGLRRWSENASLRVPSRRSSRGSHLRGRLGRALRHHLDIARLSRRPKLLPGVPRGRVW